MRGLASSWVAAAALCAALPAAGCKGGPPPIYEWGQYEECVFETCTAPEGYDGAEQIRALELQLGQARSDPGSVPPGLRLHLAFLYVEAGRVETAAVLVREEMVRFPESRVFCAGMLARLGLETAVAPDAEAPRELH